MKTFKLLALCAAIILAPAVQAERLKDLASIAGVRQNQLMGYGLVVGLDGSGDQTRIEAGEEAHDVVVAVVQHDQRARAAIEGLLQVRRQGAHARVEFAVGHGRVERHAIAIGHADQRDVIGPARGQVAQVAHEVHGVRRGHIDSLNGEAGSATRPGDDGSGDGAARSSTSPRAPCSCRCRAMPATDRPRIM